MVHTHAPEEAQTRSEIVDAHTGVDTGAQVLEAVGQRVCQLDVGRGAGFLHMVARNGYAVEFRHIFRGVFKNVGDDFHRRQGRIDVGVAHHKLLEDVVLDGALQLLLLYALLLGGDDVEGQNGQHGAVHSHRNAHLVERNLVEEDLHIEDAVDSHTCLADVAHNALVVRVVAAVRGQVEGHRKALLAGGDVAAIEGVGFLGG